MQHRKKYEKLLEVKEEAPPLLLNTLKAIYPVKPKEVYIKASLRLQRILRHKKLGLENIRDHWKLDYGTKGETGACNCYSAVHSYFFFTAILDPHIAVDLLICTDKMGKQQ